MHAILSASGSNQWINCPPSIRLGEGIKEKTSDYAREGTLAHELSELMLNFYQNNISSKKYNQELQKMKKSEFYSDELTKYVQEYVNFAIEKMSCYETVLIEARLDFSHWVPQGFGTGDLVLISDNMLEVIDLKFGKGIKVSAIDNSQMRLYALGAISQFGFLYDIKTVRMTIHQPRLDSISTDEITIDELLGWAETIVKPKAELAFKGEGEFKAGDHCRWCKIKATCRRRYDEAIKLAELDFKPAPELTDEEIVEVLFTIDNLQKWAKDIEEYALQKAISGEKTWSGLKLVEGRRTRRYSSEEKVAETLLEAGYEEQKIYSKSLLSLTKLEKQIGKKEFETILGDLISRPPGKPKLVPESDKRKQIQSDFKEEY